MNYQLIAVKPYDIPEEWVFQLDGKASDIDVAKYIRVYLYSMGIQHFTVTHYSKAHTHIAIEDICLN